DAVARSALRRLTSGDSATTAGLALATPDGAVVFRPLLGPLAGKASFDLSSRSGWRLGLAVSGDDGVARTMAGLGSDGQLTVLNAQPLYGSEQIPDSVQGRRAGLVGFVATLESPHSLTSSSFDGSSALVGAELLQGTTV